MNELHVGFTGTEQGMTDKQMDFVRYQLQRIWEERKGRSLHVHHGDCLGADCEFHQIAMTYPEVTVHVHPPENPKSRAFCLGDIIYRPKAYLIRNHDIVNASSILFVAPRGNTEELRSGTWATYRYGKKMGLDIIMVKR